jgi:hypothetical protein
MIESLKSIPSQSILVVLTLIGLVAMILIGLQFVELGNQMQAAGGYGIVCYELAFTPKKVSKILTAWGPAGKAPARRSLLIDFAFIPVYALFFGGLTLLIARTQVGLLASVGLWLTLGQIAAALFDGLENILLLTMLSSTGDVSILLPLTAGIAASLKFVLLLLAIVYWCVCGIAWVAGWLRR